MSEVVAFLLIFASTSGGKTSRQKVWFVGGEGGGMFLRVALLCIFATCALGISTYGALAITLREAVQHTISTNPNVGSSQADRRAAGYVLRQAQSRLLPQVDVTAQFGQQRVDRDSLAPQLNRIWRNNREATLTVRQILFDGWNRANDIYKNAARIDASAWRVMESSEARALDAVEAYIDVWRHLQLLGIAKHNVARHRDILNRVRQRRSGGKAALSEVDQTEERLLAAQAVMQEVRQAWLEAVAKFRSVIGLDPAGVRRVSFPGRVPRSQQAARDGAISNSPIIRAAKADVDAAGFEADQVESGYLPEVSLQGSASFGADLDGTPGRDDDLTGQVVLTWNLFNGFATTNRHRELAERRNQAIMELNARMREVTEAIDRAWAAYSIGQNRVALFAQQTSKAEQVVSAYKQEYELSKRSLLDLLDSENAHFSSRFQLISVTAVRLFSAYQLLASMGELLRSLGVAAPMETIANHREQSQKTLGIFRIEIEPLRKP